MYTLSRGECGLLIFDCGDAMGDVGPKSYIVINMKKITAIIIYKIEGSRQSRVHCSTPASQNHHEYIGMMSFDTIITRTTIKTHDSS